MYKNSQQIYIKAISPIHAGTGQSLTSVDMPIQREKHTNIPKIEGSSLKGSIKHTIYHKKEFTKDNIRTKKAHDYKIFQDIFGPDDNGESVSSAIAITDAKLLLFPMRSATDIYQLITCPYILKRWRAEQENISWSLEIPEVEDGKCITDTSIKSMNNNSVMLEEYIFEAKKISLNNVFNNIGNLDQFLNKMVILSDSDFIDMVTMYTEIITRNKIKVETGTAQGTGLFSEEYLPAETIMYFSVLDSAFYKSECFTPIEYFKQNIGTVFQVGGNETIGKGLMKIIHPELLIGGDK